MLYKIQHKEKARKTYTLTSIGTLYGGRCIMCTATVTQHVLRPWYNAYDGRHTTSHTVQRIYHIRRNQLLYCGNLGDKNNKRLSSYNDNLLLNQILRQYDS